MESADQPFIPARACPALSGTGSCTGGRRLAAELRPSTLPAVPSVTSYAGHCMGLNRAATTQQLCPGDVPPVVGLRSSPNRARGETEHAHGTRGSGGAEPRGNSTALPVRPLLRDARTGNEDTPSCPRNPPPARCSGPMVIRAGVQVPGVA